jgi:hypothetical protein
MESMAGGPEIAEPPHLLVDGWPNRTGNELVTPNANRKTDAVSDEVQ